jgi:hypothetical protein
MKTALSGDAGPPSNGPQTSIAGAPGAGAPAAQAA